MKGTAPKTWPLTPQEMYSKRRRLDASSPMCLNTSTDTTEANSEHTNNDIASLRIKLSHAESTIKIRRQMSDLARQELAVLEQRCKVESEAMRQQQVDLEAASTTLQEAREAQAAAESELSQVKASMQKRIDDLMLRNASLAGKTVHSTRRLPRTPSQDPQRISDIETKLRDAQQRIMELEQQLDRRSILPGICNLQKVKLDQARGTIKNMTVDLLHREPSKDLLALILTCINRLDGQLQTTMDLIPIIHSGNISGQNTRQDVTGSIKLPSVKLEKMEPDIGSKTISRNRVLPTDPKFFKIDWNSQYCRDHYKKKWSCKKCSRKYTSEVQIQDHVWNKHYKQRFKCALCDYRFSWRATVTTHFKKIHPALFCDGRLNREHSEVFIVD